MGERVISDGSSTSHKMFFSSGFWMSHLRQLAGELASKNLNSNSHLHLASSTPIFTFEHFILSPQHQTLCQLASLTSISYLSLALTNSNSTQTCLLHATFLASSTCMSCSCQTNPERKEPYHYHLTCLTSSSYIFLVHVSACLGPCSLLSLASLCFYFVTPTLTSFSFSLSCLLSLIVPLAPFIMFLCPVLSLRNLCRTFLNTFCLALHLQLVDHNLARTSKSSIFYCIVQPSLAALSSISVHVSCTSNTFSTNHICCRLTCAFSS